MFQIYTSQGSNAFRFLLDFFLSDCLQQTLYTVVGRQ